jgi:imidazoleglycerol-phosphate dehydratase
MLELFARHGSFALNCRIRGDVEVDLHHTIEDSGLVLGSAFKEALGDKKGIERYGFHLLPMDETLVRVALDLSGRPFLVYDAGKLSGKIGEFDMDYCRHFFHSLAFQLQMNLHIHVLYGQDKHHVVEAVFKGVARSLSRAVAITGTSIPSTKGIL